MKVIHPLQIQAHQKSTHYKVKTTNSMGRCYFGANHTTKHQETSISHIKRFVSGISEAFNQFCTLLKNVFQKIRQTFSCLWQHKSESSPPKAESTEKDAHTSTMSSAGPDEVDSMSPGDSASQFHTMDSKTRAANIRRLLEYARNGQTFSELEKDDQQFALAFIQAANQQENLAIVDIGNGLIEVLRIPSNIVENLRN